MQPFRSTDETPAGASRIGRSPRREIVRRSRAGSNVGLRETLLVRCHLTHLAVD
jgi:hypothetical protein